MRSGHTSGGGGERPGPRSTVGLLAGQVRSKGIEVEAVERLDNDDLRLVYRPPSEPERNMRMMVAAVYTVVVDVEGWTPGGLRAVELPASGGDGGREAWCVERDWAEAYAAGELPAAELVARINATVTVADDVEEAA